MVPALCALSLLTRRSLPAPPEGSYTPSRPGRSGASAYSSCRGTISGSETCGGRDGGWEGQGALAKGDYGPGRGGSMRSTKGFCSGTEGTWCCQREHGLALKVKPSGAVGAAGMGNWGQATGPRARQSQVAAAFGQAVIKQARHLLSRGKVDAAAASSPGGQGGGQTRRAWTAQLGRRARWALVECLAEKGAGPERPMPTQPWRTRTSCREGSRPSPAHANPPWRTRTSCREGSRPSPARPMPTHLSKPRVHCGLSHAPLLRYGRQAQLHQLHSLPIHTLLAVAQLGRRAACGRAGGRAAVLVGRRATAAWARRARTARGALWEGWLGYSNTPGLPS